MCRKIREGSPILPRVFSVGGRGAFPGIYSGRSHPRRAFAVATPTDERRGGREMVTEQLELGLEFEPEPVALATYFDPILGPIQGPVNLHGE
jgi:hypothetical protein